MMTVILQCNYHVNGKKLAKKEQEGIEIKRIKLIKNIDGKEVEKIIEDFKFEASYKDKFNLELAFTLKETKEFYVDFSAYD